MKETESPIEEKLLDSLLPCLAPGVRIETQVPIYTSGGNYRVDFSLITKERVYVIECDGKDFHDYKKDLWRDLNILSSGTVDEIYRFRGCDIHHSVESCVAFLRAMTPDLFDAGAKPTTPLEKVELSMLLMGNGAFKPLARFKCNLTLGLTRAYRKTKTAAVIETGNRGTAVMQVESPYWSQPKSDGIDMGLAYDLGENP